MTRKIRKFEHIPSFGSETLRLKLVYTVQNAKKIHYENLWQMVRYCENLTDCRRVLQLQYFGEVRHRILLYMRV